MYWRDTSATYKLSDISLEYDATFDEPYATTWDNADSIHQGNINSLSDIV